MFDSHQQRQQQHYQPNLFEQPTDARADSAVTMMNELPLLTSTTAPGMVFATRNELALHYKSDWHRYNLKRREAGLPMLHYHDFMARYNAAQAVREATINANSTRNGTSHIKPNKKQNSSNNKQHYKKLNKNRVGISQDGAVTISQVPNFDEQRLNNNIQSDDTPGVVDNDCIVDGGYTDATSPTEVGVVENDQEQDSEKRTSMVIVEQSGDVADTNLNNFVEENDDEVMIIDPCRSLFDNTVCNSVKSNAKRMYKKYGFFIPDQEYLIDLEGLIGYCHEKIYFGHVCLYCHKTFRSAQGCKNHMVSLSHTKLLYEPGYDLEELAVFYNFDEVNESFLKQINSAPKTTTKDSSLTNQEDSIEKLDKPSIADDEEWEDVDDEDMDEDSDDDDNEDNNNNEADDDDDMYNEYQNEIGRMGFDVTELGELVFPDGRIIGHRALRRYYKQNLRPTRDETSSTAVMAARLGAQERLYRGNVYNIGDTTMSSRNNNNRGGNMMLTHGTGTASLSSATHNSSTMLRQAGIAPKSVTGRVGKGILVATSNNAGTGTIYSQLSVYRYRAAVRKQRREDFKGKRIHEKQHLNMNHMDKRHNNKMTGVSVAHALR